MKILHQLSKNLNYNELFFHINLTIIRTINVVFKEILKDNLERIYEFEAV